MRITLRLDDGLHRQAKTKAARSGVTRAAFVEQALRKSLGRRAQRARRKPIRLPVFKGGGLQPGVDLDDTVALLELMEGRAPRR